MIEVWAPGRKKRSGAGESDEALMSEEKEEENSLNEWLWNLTERKMTL